MSNLEVIENGVVKVYNHQQERIVDARELHRSLESKDKYSQWINRRIKKYGFEEGVDFFTLLGKSNGGRPSNEYFLKIDTAKEIAMVENNERGRQIRKYFIEIEKRYSQQNNQPPTTLESLQTMINNMVEQEKKMKRLESQFDEQNNKVTKIQSYLTETPDRSKIDRKIKEYARINNIDESQARTNIYNIIKDKYGVDVFARVNNKRKKINQERIESGKKSYTDNTLKNKYNGMDLLSDLDMFSDIMEILSGLTK